MVTIKEAINSFFIEKTEGPVSIEEMKNIFEMLKGNRNYSGIQDFCQAQGAMVLKIKKNAKKLGIEVSKDGMSVYVSFVERPTAENVFEALNREGIINGINFDLLAKELLKGGNRILAARGFAPGEPVDERVEWLVDIKNNLDRSPEVEKTGFYSLDLFTFVKSDEKVARIISPILGNPGKNVYGERIQPSAPKKLSLRLKDGFKRKGEFIVAEKDGIVELKNNRLSLDPVLMISSDINRQTGDINSDSTIQINGWVMSGFSVKSSKNIYIKGGIRDKTSVKAAGDLSVGLGIMGKEDLKIVVDGDLRASYIQNADIKVKGNVYVNEYIMNSVVVSEGSVYVNGEKGAIINSTVDAKVSVELREYRNTKKKRGIKVKGFRRKKYLESLKELQKKRISLKSTMQNLTLKLRNIKNENKEELRKAFSEYQMYEIDLYNAVEEIDSISSMLGKIEGEGMIKLLSNSNNIKLKIKGQEIEINNSEPVKLYYDPEKRGVVQECIEKN